MKKVWAKGHGSDDETYTRRWEALQRQAAEVLDGADLGAVLDALEDLDALMGALPGQLADLRAQGYRYRADLEARVTRLSQGWPAVRRRATEAREEAQRRLRSGALEARRALEQARHARSPAALDAAQAELKALERRTQQARRHARGAFDRFAQQAQALKGDLDHLLWASEQLAGASFPLYPAEGLVDACQAQWLTRQDEGPKGTLFLTDARLIFEQREKVATKKVLFVAVKKKLVQELQFAAPIGGVEIVEAEDARGGFLGLAKRERLTLRFTTRTEGHDVPQARLRLLQGADNQAWVGQIQRVQREELVPVGGRAGTSGEASDPQGAAPSPEIPTHCPSCGAPLTAPVVKGMHEIRCAYCGVVLRIA